MHGGIGRVPDVAAWKHVMAPGGHSIGIGVSARIFLKA